MFAAIRYDEWKIVCLIDRNILCCNRVQDCSTSQAHCDCYTCAVQLLLLTYFLTYVKQVLIYLKRCNIDTRLLETSLIESDMRPIELCNRQWSWATVEDHARYYKRFHCLCLKNTACIMYEVYYDCRTSYVSNYFYCCIQPEGLWGLYDAECDLFALAKFLYCKMYSILWLCLVFLVSFYCVYKSWCFCVILLHTQRRSFAS